MLEDSASKANTLDGLTNDSKTTGFKILPPSRLAVKLICPAFESKPFPFDNRQFFEIRHRIALLLGVKELVEHHRCLLPADGFEKRSGNGFMDAELMDHIGESIRLEATGSDWIKIQKIVQACLYRPSDTKKTCGRVFVSSIEERLEVPRSLIRTINAKAPEIVAFINDNPEVASHLYLPHSDICPQCDIASCPHWKRMQFAGKLEESER